MKKKLIVLSSFVLGLAPAVALAAVTPASTCIPGAPVTDLISLLCKIGYILNAIVPVLVALGVVYFIWGVITYVISSDEEAKKAGRNRIIFGIIGLAVIVGMWGLVRILGTTFGIQSGSGTNAGITLPGVQ